MLAWRPAHDRRNRNPRTRRVRRCLILQKEFGKVRRAFIRLARVHTGLSELVEVLRRAALPHDAPVVPPSVIRWFGNERRGGLFVPMVFLTLLISAIEDEMNRYFIPHRHGATEIEIKAKLILVGQFDGKRSILNYAPQ